MEKGSFSSSSSSLEREGREREGEARRVSFFPSACLPCQFPPTPRSSWWRERGAEDLLFRLRPSRPLSRGRDGGGGGLSLSLSLNTVERPASSSSSPSKPSLLLPISLAAEAEGSTYRSLSPSKKGAGGRANPHGKKLLHFMKRVVVVGVLCGVPFQAVSPRIKKREPRERDATRFLFSPQRFFSSLSVWARRR